MSDLTDQLKTILGYGKDVAQGASNAIAGNVSGPVDLISYGLRKAGLGNVIGDAPVGGSAWMAQKGLTPQPTNALAGMAGETLGLIGPTLAAGKAPQIANGLLQMGENAAKPSTLNPQMGAIVYHGSPHSFDKFDMGKIGTGEGAQAYGHGLYFADNPTVANQYAKDLSASRQSLTNRGLAGAGGDVDAAIEKAQGEIARLKALPNGGGDPARQAKFIALNEEKLAELAKLKAGQQMSQPNLYKVDLPDEHIAKMLDWDKPLSQQSPEVQKILQTEAAKMAAEKSAAARASFNAKLAAKGLPPRFAGEAEAPNVSGWTGQQFHDAIASQLGGKIPVSEYLRQQGIPGIKYLDQGSRGAGDGTRNYVVFDDKLPKILERNGQSLGDQLRDKLK